MRKKVEACLPFFLSKQRPPAEGAAQIFEKFIPQMEKKRSLLFLSQQRPSAEGPAKIFEKFIPQMEKQN
jgi:hypothetical protein